MARPQTFTSRERLMKKLADEIFASGIPYQKLADGAGVKSATTIRKVANGDTIWPRPQTLFGLIQVLRLHIELVNDVDRRKK